ncbi:MAG: alpha/beta hydrolase family protein [Promethearchaeota archaeon]
MEFRNKEFDGPYEVSEVQIDIEGLILRGILYFPGEKYKKPYPIVIHFHGFPQLFTLTEIVKKYEYLLTLGYSLIVFNFRGYRFSEGKISIKSQVTDALSVIQFVEKMAKNGIFDINDVNILGHDFGAYITLFLCSKINFINRIILICPILDLKKHVYGDEFSKVLSYINRFLPGNLNGIQNINDFIELTKNELKIDEFQIKKFIKNLKYRKMKIITGECDKITPLSEVKKIINQIKNKIELYVIKNMDHDCINEDELEILKREILNYFSKK